jgi:hypothetical protein
MRVLFNKAMTSKSALINQVCFQIGVCTLATTTSFLFTYDNDRSSLKFIQIFGFSSNGLSVVNWLQVLVFIIILKQIQIKIHAEHTMI